MYWPFFCIPMTMKQFEHNLMVFVGQGEGWRSGPDDIREADEITLLCDPFRGLVLELDWDKANSEVVAVIRVELYTALETPTTKWTRPPSTKSIAALYDWLKSQEKTSGDVE